MVCYLGGSLLAALLLPAFQLFHCSFFLRIGAGKIKSKKRKSDIFLLEAFIHIFFDIEVEIIGFSDVLTFCVASAYAVHTHTHTRPSPGMVHTHTYYFHTLHRVKDNQNISNIFPLLNLI